jgi:hypothetical protein
VQVEALRSAIPLLAASVTEVVANAATSAGEAVVRAARQEPIDAEFDEVENDAQDMASNARGGAANASDEVEAKSGGVED